MIIVIHCVNFMSFSAFMIFAIEVRVNKGVMYGRNLNAIGDTLCVQWLLGHLFHEFLDGVLVMNIVANFMVRLHFEDKVAILSVHISRMEDT